MTNSSGNKASTVAVPPSIVPQVTNVDHGHMLRILMPSVFALSLGVQIVTSSFFGAY